MKIYKWKTSIGYFNSFDDMTSEYARRAIINNVYSKRTVVDNIKNIKWYRAVERNEDSELTIVKYLCPCCENIVIGIIPIIYDSNQFIPELDVNKLWI